MPFLQQGTVTARNSKGLLAARPDSTRQSRTKTRRCCFERLASALRPHPPGSFRRGDGATDVPIVSSGGTHRRAGGMALAPGWHALRCRGNAAASAVGRGGRGERDGRDRLLHVERVACPARPRAIRKDRRRRWIQLRGIQLRAHLRPLPPVDQSSGTQPRSSGASSGPSRRPLTGCGAAPGSPAR